MKITSDDLLELKIIEGIISEHGNINENFEETIIDIKNTINDFLGRTKASKLDDLLEARYNRFRKFGNVRWKI